MYGVRPLFTFIPPPQKTKPQLSTTSTTSTTSTIQGNDKISTDEAGEMLREVSHPKHLVEVCTMVGKGRLIDVVEGHEAASASKGGKSRSGKKKTVTLSESEAESSSDDGFQAASSQSESEPEEEDEKKKKKKGDKGISPSKKSTASKAAAGEDEDEAESERRRRKKKKKKHKHVPAKVKDDYRYKMYFRLVELGMDKELIKLKVAAEHLDLDPKLLDTPDAPPPK